MGIILTGCQQKTNEVVTSVEELMINEVVEADFITSPGKVNGKINFYYMNNQATPYLEFNQFLSKFPKLFSENMKVERGETEITVTYKYAFEQGIYEDEFRIDFEQNTLFFSNIEKSFLGERVKEAEPIEINLNEVGIELYVDENNKLLPGYLCDFLMAYYWGQNLYYTSNQMYMISYGSPVYDEMWQQYRENLGEASNEVEQESIHYLTFLMDNFYGLKNYRQVESYQPIISELFSEREYEQNLSQFIVGLNDGHSSIIEGSQALINDYEEALDQSDYNVQVKTAYKNNLCREQKETIVDYREDVIYMDYRTFDSHDETKYKNVLENTSRKTIILDLRCNTGGQFINMKDLLDFLSNGLITIYTADTQGGLDETKADNRNSENDYIVLTSALTYSAGNAFANIVKENNLATIIGEKTAGGAAIVGFFGLPDGTQISLSRSRLMVNSQGELIEDGIEPDIPLTFTPEMDIKETLLKIIDQQD